MIAVFAANRADAPLKSSISNSEIHVRHDEAAPYLFHSKEDGSMIVTLAGYLICPLDMFTRRQIKTAQKKYRAKAGR
jgi:hypothetical protein